MACGCMRGTVSPCHVALSEDTRLLVRVRPCGPCSTIFERRSRSRWHEPTRSAARGAETGCAPGNSHKSSDTSLDLLPTLRSFGPSFSRVAFRLAQVLALHGLPVCACSAPACAYLASVFVFASRLVLADTACLRERVVLARVPSCANALHLFARAFPVHAQSQRKGAQSPRAK